MPLKVTSNDTGVWVTWGTPDEGISTTFRIKKTDSDDEILKKLIRLTRFIASQMGELASEIETLEAEIMGTSAPAPAPATMSTPQTATTASSTPVVPDPSAPRIPMMSPASLSDLPAGGAPVSTFGWGSMPTTSVPAQLAAPEAGGWEMIPPEEM